MCQPIIFWSVIFYSFFRPMNYEDAHQLSLNHSQLVSRIILVYLRSSSRSSKPSKSCHKIVSSPSKRWKNIGNMSPNHNIVKWLESFTNHASELVKLSADKDTLDSKETWEFLDRKFFSMKGAKWCTNKSCPNRGKKYLKCDIEIQYRFNPDTREGEIKIGKIILVHKEPKCNKCYKVIEIIIICINF